MHTGPSEAALTRQVLEKEMREHEATRAQLELFRKALEHTLQHAAKFNVNMRFHVAVEAALGKAEGI